VPRQSAEFGTSFKFRDGSGRCQSVTLKQSLPATAGVTAAGNEGRDALRTAELMRPDQREVLAVSEADRRRRLCDRTMLALGPRLVGTGRLGGSLQRHWGEPGRLALLHDHALDPLLLEVLGAKPQRVPARLQA
jgi:hypothetical protein